ncbi:MAG: 8-oxo-dGTP diphosphatase MutT [Synergistaceae bacterium]
MSTKVSAAIIQNEDGDILICQRKAGGSCAFLWEFPGGKQEEFETAEECLIRECLEELDVKIEIIGLFKQKEYSYPEKKIFFSFYKAQIVDGNLKMIVHNNLTWSPIDELSKYTFCPADIDIINKIVESEKI